VPVDDEDELLLPAVLVVEATGLAADAIPQTSRNSTRL
jgi:hypothetical protein